MDAQNSLQAIIDLQNAIEHMRKVEPSRSNSIALTNAETSLLWLQKDYDERTEKDFVFHVEQK